MGHADQQRVAPDPRRVHLNPRTKPRPATRNPNPGRWNRRQPDTTVGPVSHPRPRNTDTTTHLGKNKPRSESARKIEANAIYERLGYQAVQDRLSVDF